MSTTIDYKPVAEAKPAVDGRPLAVEEPFVEGEGWIAFAAVMLVLGGALGLIHGILALTKSSFFVAGAHFVFSDLRTWGWIVAIVGGLTLFAGLAVSSGSAFARWFGICLAGLQALAQLMMIQAYPFWSLCVFAIDLVVIYALAVYGGAMLRRQT